MRSRTEDRSHDLAVLRGRRTGGGVSRLLQATSSSWSVRGIPPAPRAASISRRWRGSHAAQRRSSSSRSTRKVNRCLTRRSHPTRSTGCVSLPMDSGAKSCSRLSARTSAGSRGPSPRPSSTTSPQTLSTHSRRTRRSSIGRTDERPTVPGRTHHDPMLFVGSGQAFLRTLPPRQSPAREEAAARSHDARAVPQTGECRARGRVVVSQTRPMHRCSVDQGQGAALSASSADRLPELSPAKTQIPISLHHRLLRTPRG